MINDLVFFSLLNLTFIRIVGTLISLKFYLEAKRLRFLALVTGWALWTVTGFLPILADYIEETNQFTAELLLVFNIILAIVGFILITSAIFTYFIHNLSIKLVIALSSLFIIFPLLLFFLIDYITAVTITGNILIVLYFLVLFYGVMERHRLRTYIGSSIGLLYGMITFILCYLAVYLLFIPKEEFIYGLYDSNDIFSIIVQYVFAIGITILFLILIIQIEQGIASQTRFLLTDTYSHDIGNKMQIILVTLELLEEVLPENRTEIELLKSKCIEAGDLISEIRKNKP